MVERAIFAAVMILIAGPAWADSYTEATTCNYGFTLTPDKHLACVASGGSGYISTIDQVNKAKALVDDITEKRSELDALTKITDQKVDVSLAHDPNVCLVYQLQGCAYQSIKVSRQLIIDALQYQIDDDQQKLRAMGIEP